MHTKVLMGKSGVMSMALFGTGVGKILKAWAIQTQRKDTHT